MTGLAACFLYKRIIENRYGLIAVNSFMLYALCYGLFSGYAVLGTRLANLFVYGHWLLWPLILKETTNKHLRIFAMVFIGVFLTCRIISISILPQWHYSLFF
jgi:hypothetical protein